MNCEHMTAPASPSHRENGLHTFCVRCNTFFDADGQPATAEPMAVRNSFADRIAAANAKFHGGTSEGLASLERAFRHGGTLN